MFQIEHYKQNQLYVVSIHGEISRGTVAQINQHLKPLMFSMENEKKLKGILLECRDVEFIDSAGIGMLCGKYVNLKKQKKAFALCSLKVDLMEVLHKLSLTDKINLYPSIRDAIHEMDSSAATQEPLKIVSENPEKNEPKKEKKPVDIFNMKLGEW
ncbi:MAG: STAS domain-containing protein [SAR324 cluster bacterium]|nr:STAS domain-containing protein [SAR324 cluster bacterium]